MACSYKRAHYLKDHGLLVRVYEVYGEFRKKVTFSGQKNQYFFFVEHTLQTMRITYFLGTLTNIILGLNMEKMRAGMLFFIIQVFKLKLVNLKICLCIYATSTFHWPMQIEKIKIIVKLGMIVYENYIKSSYLR